LVRNVEKFEGFKDEKVEIKAEKNSLNRGSQGFCDHTVHVKPDQLFLSPVFKNSKIQFFIITRDQFYMTHDHFYMTSDQFEKGNGHKPTG
jgi:hypothetical protein